MATKKARDPALAAYIKNPNYTACAKRAGISPMGFRGRVVRAAEAEGFDLKSVQKKPKAKAAKPKAKKGKARKSKKK
jgi:hypothetical protein